MGAIMHFGTIERESIIAYSPNRSDTAPCYLKTCNRDFISHISITATHNKLHIFPFQKTKYTRVSRMESLKV